MGDHRILILGGTTEARQLAGLLAGRADLDVTLSLAGRTTSPLVQPVPTRVGGFGGAEGLALYLKSEGIDLLIDATHPFAARISANAALAAGSAGVAGVALCRPPWLRAEGDRWLPVESVQQAIQALGPFPRRVFLAVGRQEAHHANAAPIHRYLVRSVDAVEPPLTVPDVCYIRKTGPFHLEDEIRLLQDERIDSIIAKNSGGDATYAKIHAARNLGLTVLMVERPPASGLMSFQSVEAVLRHIDHVLPPLMKRGV